MARLSQDQVDKRQRDLYRLEQKHFRITARVDISRLVFEKNFRRLMDGHGNTRQLERILTVEGCQRLRKDCHVPVLVSIQDWERHIRIKASTGNFPTLEVDLDCELHAQDHENLITAARKTLALNNQWWIVDVYVTGGKLYATHSSLILWFHNRTYNAGWVFNMTTENGDDEDGEDGDDQGKIAQLLQERIPNDNRPPDGLIYERIRYYEGYLGGPIDEMAAKDWWAILERAPGKKKSRKASYLRSFFKNHNLPAKLDALIPISGIWEGMSIGSLHKLIWMRCDEVSANQATSNPRTEADGRLH